VWILNQGHAYGIISDSRDGVNFAVGGKDWGGADYLPDLNFTRPAPEKM
jgi:hypothetical protein